MGENREENWINEITRMNGENRSENRINRIIIKIVKKENRIASIGLWNWWKEDWINQIMKLVKSEKRIGLIRLWDWMVKTEERIDSMRWLNGKKREKNWIDQIMKVVKTEKNWSNHIMRLNDENREVKWIHILSLLDITLLFHNYTKFRLHVFPVLMTCKLAKEVNCEWSAGVLLWDKQ